MFAMDKHSSLFVQFIADKEKRFIILIHSMAKDIENFVKQIEAPKISFLGKIVIFSCNRTVHMILDNNAGKQLS
jgi:hypothetical protein